jgi:hypothetical protein
VGLGGLLVGVQRRHTPTSRSHVRTQQHASVLAAELEKGGGPPLLLLPPVDVHHLARKKSMS